MEKLKVFGNQELLVEDLNDLQSYKEIAIRNRITDVHQSGIVKVSATEPFAITPNTPLNTTKVNVGSGIAYDLVGQRVEVMVGESVDADTQTGANPPYTWTNSVNSGDTQVPQVATPYSSGNNIVALKDYTNGVVNYIFIDYIDTLIDLTTAWGSYGSKNPKYTLDQESLNTAAGTTLKQYPYRKGGYRIVVDVTANVTDNTSTGGSFTHNSYTNAVYLGKVTAQGVGVAITSVNISVANRQYSEQYARTVKIDTPTVTGDITPTYASGSSYSLDAHIKAVGNVSKITPNNPHGQTIYDLGYGGEDIIQHRRDMHSAMVVTAVPTSTSSALYSLCSGNTWTVYNLAPNLTDGTPTEFAVSNGSVLTRDLILGANPTMGVSTMSIAFTPSSPSYPAGIYYFYLTSAGVITYTQTLSVVTGGIDPATGLPFDNLLLATLEWDTTDMIYPGSLLSVHGLIDGRRFGSISLSDTARGSQYQGDSFGGEVGQIGLLLSIKNGWLRCDGTTIDYDHTSGASIKGPQYYDLIIYLRSIFDGTGYPFTSGVPTQAVLPNMSDRTAMGVSGTKKIGSTGGSDAHTHSVSGTADNVAGTLHTHNLDLGGVVNCQSTAYYVVNYAGGTNSDMAVYTSSAGAPQYNIIKSTTSGQGGHTHTLTASTGSPSDGNPKFTALYYCIKF